MKDFISTKNLNFTFGNCKNCNANCCHGIYGTLFSQILKEEFIHVYKNFPILFIFGKELNFIKPVILLTNGIDKCPYLDDYKCSIYENRPTVCRTYPLSPNIDNIIYIDNSCPEVNKGEDFLIQSNEIKKDSFKNLIFEEYQDKYIQTHFEFNALNKKDFKLLFNINNTSFFVYKGKENSTYLQYHKKSLKNLSKLFY